MTFYLCFVKKPPDNFFLIIFPFWHLKPFNNLDTPLVVTIWCPRAGLIGWHSDTSNFFFVDVGVHNFINYIFYEHEASII